MIFGFDYPKGNLRNMDNLRVWFHSIFTVWISKRNVLLVFGLILFGVVFGVRVLQRKSGYCAQRQKKEFRVVGFGEKCVELGELEDGDKVIVGLTIGPELYQTGSWVYLRRDDLSMYVDELMEVMFGDQVFFSGSLEVLPARGKQVRYRLIHPQIIAIRRQQGLTRKIIRFVVPRFIDIQDYLVDLTRLGLAEPHGGLLVGMLFGIKGLIKGDFYHDLVDTGTVHVIAASGYNISMVAMVVLEFFSWFFKRKWAVIPAFVAIVLYTFLAGASAAVVRAAVMGVIMYAGIWFGRMYVSWWSLVVTAIVMVFVNPAYVDDVGFWLSVSATSGILLLYTKLYYWIIRVFKVQKMMDLGWKWLEKLTRLVATDLAVTLAAQVFTVPIILIVFGRFWLLSPLVNVLVLWLVPIIMFGGALKVMVGLVWPELSYLMANFVFLPLELFIDIVKGFSRVEIGRIDLEKKSELIRFSPSVIYISCVYLGLLLVYVGFLFGLIKYQKTKKKRRVVS